MNRAIAIIAAAAVLAPAGAAARQHEAPGTAGVVARAAQTHEQTHEQTPAERRTAERVRQMAARERARTEQNRRDDREEQSEKTSRTLRVSELDLSNLSGDITITRGGGSSVQLEAVKVARARTAEEAREMLKYVSIDVSERGSRAEVKAVYSGHQERARERRNLNVSVRYTVTAPEGTKISASSLSGSISVSDIKGELSLVTLSGDVRVTNAARVLSAKSTSGDVEIAGLRSDIGLEANAVSGAVRLRDSSAPRVRLGSVSGDIVVTNVQSGRIAAETMSGNVTFTTPLEKNGRYELSSHSGVIRVVPTGNTGFEVDADSFSGNIRSEIALKDERQGVADIDRRGRGGRTRSLRGIFGDGSAILDITTFSGTVVIGQSR